MHYFTNNGLGLVSSPERAAHAGQTPAQSHAERLGRWLSISRSHRAFPRRPCAKYSCIASPSLPKILVLSACLHAPQDQLGSVQSLAILSRGDGVPPEGKPISSAVRSGHCSPATAFASRAPCFE